MALLLVVAADLFLIVGLPWFWSHCARPCLVAMHARSAAFRLVLGLTAAAILASAIDLVFRLLSLAELHSAARPVLLLVIVAYVVAVGGGFLNNYKVLIRITGGAVNDARSSVGGKAA